MGVEEIDLHAWRSLTAADRDKVLVEVLVEVAARSGTTLDLNSPGRARFVHRGMRYAFVPASGELTVGYDGARFRPSLGQEEHGACCTSTSGPWRRCSP